MWHLKKEKLLLEGLQQTNINDDQKVGVRYNISVFGATTAKIFTKNVNIYLCCDVLQTELKRSVAKFLKKTKMIYRQDFIPRQTSSIVKGKIAKLKRRVLDYPDQSHPIRSDGNSSEAVGTLGVRFRQRITGCRKMPESQGFDRIQDHSYTFRHPTTSGRNPIPRILTTSDEFLSDPIKSDNFFDRIQWDPTVGLLVLDRLQRVLT